MTIQDCKIILGKAICKYGIPVQKNICIEEMSELTKALLKLRRLNEADQKGVKGCEFQNNILEEIADVQITLDQMRLIYGNITDQEEFKLNRLAQRLSGDTP